MLQLSDIRKKLNIPIQKNIFNDHLKNWSGHVHKYGYTIDYDVYLPTKRLNLQRNFCWTLDQKRELILSIIKDTYIQSPTILIHMTESGEKIFKVIDGKQRLSTMIDFIDDKFTIILFDTEYYFSELPKDIQTVIGMYNLYFDQAYEYYDDIISDNDKIEWFNTLNFAGTPQDIEHLNKLYK